MTEYGEIIEIKSDQAVVKVRRSAACGDCCACSMGTNPDDMLLTVPNAYKVMLAILSSWNWNPSRF